METNDVFATEATDTIATLERCMLELERGTASAELIDEAFRAAHSLKGAAGLFDRHDVVRVAHAIEDVLSALRGATGRVGSEDTHILFAAIDVLKELLEDDSTVDVDGVVAALLTLIGRRPSVRTGRRSQRAVEMFGLDEAPAWIAPRSADNTRSAAHAGRGDDERTIGLTDVPASSQGVTQHPDVPTLPEARGPAMWFDDEPAVSPVPAPSPSIEASPIAVMPAIPAAARTPREGRVERKSTLAGSFSEMSRGSDSSWIPGTAGDEGRGARAMDRARATTLRVATEKVERVIELLGELVISHSAVMLRASEGVAAKDKSLGLALASVDTNIRHLHERIMAIRMTRVESLFDRMQRAMRDATQTLGKPARLEVAGSDTEIDNGVLQALSDPLTHLVRNAVDHGLEATNKRVEAGKPAEGTVTLRSYYRGSNVIIEVADDGGGIDHEAVWRKAVALGLQDPNEVMTPQAAYRLLFRQGLTTKEQVSEISGRGVGLDVVNDSIGRLGGTIEIDSERGRGTTFRLVVPLTLALVDGLVTTAGDRAFVVPISGMVQALRPRPEEFAHRAGVGDIVAYLDRWIPLVRLDRYFGVEGRARVPSDGQVLVAEADRGLVGFLVDDVVAHTRAVIKTTDGGVLNVPGFSGATVLADGSVALIADLRSIASIVLADTDPSLLGAAA